MVITTTAIAFTSLATGLAFCGWRFWAAFKTIDTDSASGRVGFLLSFFLGASAFQNGILGIGSLLFAPSSAKLSFVLTVSHVTLIFHAVVGIYTAYYIFLPHSSPRVPILLTGILGATGLIIFVATPPKPFVTLQNGIDWNMNPPLSLITACLLFISIGAFIYIFTRLFFKTKSREVKLFSTLLTIAALIALVNIFTSLVLFSNESTTLRTRVFDTGVEVVGALFFVAIVGVFIRESFLAYFKRKSGKFYLR